jgi:RimJ/RimL family protein N-acetyltransferase
MIWLHYFKSCGWQWKDRGGIMSGNYWQGKKVRLRAIEPTDAEFFIKWNLDSDLGRHLDFVWPPVSEASVQEWVKQRSQEKLKDDSYHWIIEDRYGVPVGSIDTHSCNARNGTFSYALHIDPDYRGKGYARESIFMVLRYYFEELRYQKVTIPVHSNNDSSIGLHQRLGFQEEGRHRRMLFTQGVYYDVIWYGMTIEEFREVQRNLPV